MDDTSNPQQGAVPAYGAATPLETALRQIQAWFVNGDFEKVKQGCREVLTIAPNNSIAQDLLKRASQSEAPAPLPPAPAPAPVEPTPPPFMPSTPEAIPQPSPTPTPSAHATDFSPEPPMPEIISTPDLTHPAEDNIHHTHSLIINIAILVGIVVVGIGGIYGYNAFVKGGDEIPAQEEDAEEQPANEEVPPADEIDETSSDTPSEPAEPSPDLTTWEGRNEKRSQDLAKLEQALILYFDEFNQYPNTDEISNMLIENGMLTELPTPPNDSEAYVYAVYGNAVGADQIFILSAEFEQENGEKTVWSTGGNSSEYSDYRDVAASHVTIVHPNMTELDYLEFLSSNYPETPTSPPSGRVPRVPRN